MNLIPDRDPGGQTAGQTNCPEVCQGSPQFLAEVGRSLWEIQLWGGRAAGGRRRVLRTDWLRLDQRSQPGLAGQVPRPVQCQPGPAHHLLPPPGTDLCHGGPSYVTQLWTIIVWARIIIKTENSKNTLTAMTHSLAGGEEVWQDVRLRHQGKCGKHPGESRG